MNIRRAALSLLARRDHSEYNLKQKLMLKGYPQAEINALLSDFLQKQWLDDARFTKNYIRARRAKGFGYCRLLKELQNYGIASEIIAEYLDITDNAWLHDIKQVWEKRFKCKMALAAKDKAKQMRFLAQRGFTQDQIYYFFDTINKI